MPLKQFILTPAMGKRLIGQAMAQHPTIQAVLGQGTLVIIAGTTNGYVAEEVLRATGQLEGFSRKGFRRGLVLPPGGKAEGAQFGGDVVLVEGQWQKGLTIFDAVDSLKAGDVVLKGANMLDVLRGQSAVYIGDGKCGTIGAALQAVIGRRVQLIVPVGLEKRVVDDLADLAELVNAPDAEGPRMLVMPGESFTELDALEQLTGATAVLLGGGGIGGAEGCVWIGVRGTPGQLDHAAELIKALAAEPPCVA